MYGLDLYTYWQALQDMLTNKTIPNKLIPNKPTCTPHSHQSRGMHTEIVNMVNWRKVGIGAV